MRSPCAASSALQMRGKGGKEGVADGRHNHTNQVRAVLVQVASQLVGHVVELLHGGVDPLTHVVGHVSGLVDHQRNRAQRNPGLFRHVTHADHCPTPLPRIVGMFPYKSRYYVLFYMHL